MTIGRNDPCPCGSGRKYKKCCLQKDQADAVADTGWIRMRRTEGDLVYKLRPYILEHLGREAFMEAWDAYTMWPEAPEHIDDWPEFDTSFPSWITFDWEPEREEDDEWFKMTPARHYAWNRGNRLDSYERRYIEAASAAPLTFFMVVEAVPGREITLRDVMLQRDVTVRERQASTTLRSGQIVYTKVVELDGDAVMLGCAPYSIPSRYFDHIVELRERFARNHDMSAGLVRELRYELHEMYLDIREAMLNPSPPMLDNTDGDPFQPTRIEYDLKCSPEEAYHALLPLTLKEDPAEYEEDCERDKAGELVAIGFPWLRPGNAQNPEWENTVLAHFEIRNARMTVNVNSEARAEAVKAEIAERLDRRADLKGTVIESFEQMMAKAETEGPSAARSEREREREELMESPEIQAAMKKMNDEHWRTWPDIPLPALDGETPRDAAKTPAGRERLEVLLLEFAGHAEAPGFMGPDLAALRRELGLQSNEESNE